MGQKPGVPGEPDQKWLDKWRGHNETRKERKNGENMAKGRYNRTNQTYTCNSTFKKGRGEEKSIRYPTF